MRFKSLFLALLLLSTSASATPPGGFSLSSSVSTSAAPVPMLSLEQLLREEAESRIGRFRDEDYILPRGGSTRAQRLIEPRAAESTSTTVTLAPAPASSMQTYIDTENQLGLTWFTGALSRVLGQTTWILHVSLVELIGQYVLASAPLAEQPIVAPRMAPTSPFALTSYMLRHEYTSLPHQNFMEFAIAPSSQPGIWDRPEIRRLGEAGLLVPMSISSHPSSPPEEQLVLLFMRDVAVPDSAVGDLLTYEEDIENDFTDAMELIDRMLFYDDQTLRDIRRYLNSHPALAPEIRNRLDEITRSASERHLIFSRIYNVINAQVAGDDDLDEPVINASILTAYQLWEVMVWASQFVYRSETSSLAVLEHDMAARLLDSRIEIEKLFDEILDVLECHSEVLRRRLGFPSEPSFVVPDTLRTKMAVAKKKRQKKKKPIEGQRDAENAPAPPVPSPAPPTMTSPALPLSTTPPSSARISSSQLPDDARLLTLRMMARAGLIGGVVGVPRTRSDSSTSSPAVSTPPGTPPGHFRSLTTASSRTSTPESDDSDSPSEFALTPEQQQQLVSYLEAHEGGTSYRVFWALFFPNGPGAITLEAQMIQDLAKKIEAFLVGKLGISPAAARKWCRVVTERTDHGVHRRDTGREFNEHDTDVARSAFIEYGVMPPTYTSKGTVDDRWFKKLGLRTSRLKRGA